MENTTVLSPTRSRAGADSRLHKFFYESLQDIYYAEKHLVDALETLRDEATTEELKRAFDEHRGVTEGHVARLEQVFEAIGEDADTRKCEAIKGIIKEADSIIRDTESDTLTRDAALILAGQKAEHYEIATYGSLVQFAKILGEYSAADLLQQTLDEEKEADQALTKIAEGFINEKAREEVEA
jgi:ferritin-like metal-binding protein YciE